MTREEAVKMLRAKLYCIELDTRGARDCNEQNCDNCPYNYEQGNMGEQKQALDMAIKALEQESVINKIREEIKAKIEQEEFARSVFIHEEKNTARAKQCEGRIIAYNNVIKIIDKYKTESEK